MPSSSSTATFPMRPKPPPKAPKGWTTFASLSAGDRLTQKFPISKTIRGLALEGSQTCDATRSVMATPESIGSSLERSRGLGMDRPNRWTPHKWWLFLSVCTVFASGALGLVYALLTWFKAWEHADVFFVADYDVLVLITLASSLLLFTFIVGMTGTILNSRPILAMYALLLWPAFIAILAVGYTSYKRSAFALDRKLNLAWSKYYSAPGRLIVQDSLWCCGYNSPLHEAAASGRCFARAALPGCKGKLLRFERAVLQTVYTAAFGAVPLHIANIVAALLCANHVTRTFGKGITPRQYRLCGADVQSDAEKILGTMQTLGPVRPPAASRPLSFVSYREDREDPPPPPLGIPAALRPGIPSGLWRRHKHG
ncbi:tetraspanin family protein [Phanerochaete sordida]|uniref:Tetraspanin family protein n=1 Tax=Phanerochaete sordida TaxID=48140 RepID=A0A9P3GF69_9APHY|nr:tetraspanin family protein [Phanerochaete sordida]